VRSSRQTDIDLSFRTTKTETKTNKNKK